MAAPHNFVSVSRRPPDVEDYIDILRRYRSWVIGPAFAGLVISVVVAFWWPDMYVCSASMQIKPGAVPTSLMPSADVGRMAQRLQQLQIEILGRDNLIAMIQSPLDLYKKERARYPTEDVAEEYFRKHVHIDRYSSDADSRGGQAFRISFEYPDRVKARAVVLALVTQFQDKNTALQFDTASSASGFLDEVVKNARDKMDKAQMAITAFSTENQGRLPDNFQSNMLDVQSKSTTLANINEAISTEKQHQALLESALNNNKNLQSQAEANVTQTQTSSNSAVKNQNLINLEQMIAAENVKLQSLQLKYQPGFPDVVAEQDAIAALEKRRDNILKEEGTNGAARPANTVVQTRNPQVEQQLTNLRAEENNIRAQIQASVLAIENKTRQSGEVAKQLERANDKVAASPAIVQQFNRLTEDLTMARTDYQNLSGKKDQSEQTAKMEERRAGETLEILEQPITPDTPTSPVRPAIVGIGTLVGLVLGFVLSGAKEIKDTSLKNLKDVRAYTNLPVLSSIPLLENALLVRRKRRLAWLAWSSAIIVGSILMTGAMYYHYVVVAQQVS